MLLNCRASHTGDALRIGGVRGCQAQESVLAAQVLNRVGSLGKLRAQSSRERLKV